MPGKSDGKRMWSTTSILALTCGLVSLAFFASSNPSAAARLKAAPTGLLSQSNLAVTNGKIAFTNTKDRNVEIYVMNSDGGGQTRITDNPAFDGDPAWSPDGTRIAFTSTRDGNEEIYVMNADGTIQTRLTNNSDLDRSPVWSPDGAQIAFASNRNFGVFAIFVMNSDGTGQRNISTNRAFDYQDPDWSPDGLHIACSQAPIVDGQRGNYGVLVMNADGSSQTFLSADGNIDITPRWSPDGMKLVFASDRPGNFGTFEVFTMSVDGANQTRLTNNPNENSRPGWSPDGTRITFQSDRHFSFDVFTMNPDGGNQVQLTGTFFEEAQPVWQPTAPQAINPIDDPRAFVRRLYLDFLNREPDPAGFAYWVGQITECGTDQVCINHRRVTVAAAFFIEQEFQQTGFFIYRFNQASLCRRPTFAEFMLDRDTFFTGTDLETNKESFAENFVQRAEFLQNFPLFMGRDAFIDALLAQVRTCSGTDLTSLRSALIAQYNSSTSQTISRARVVRTVIENPTFVAAEFNKGFVLAEYFGFLRRDPDQAGFDFWLNVLNNGVPGNFRAMVCGFITSAEFQRRFGPNVTHSNSECGE